MHEMLTAYDDDKTCIGVVTRQEVHAKGYWHDTFHCWFISRSYGRVYLYFQVRSSKKKDYPNLLDITAAGHIVADEETHDGILREIREEVGMSLEMGRLELAGVIDYCVILDDFIDKEIAEVYVCVCEHNFEQFHVDPEEVSGIVRTELDRFAAFWNGEADSLYVEGFEVNDAKEATPVGKLVGKDAFVQHTDTYYLDVLNLIKKTTFISAKLLNEPRN